jgi:hypothetical protein
MWIYESSTGRLYKEGGELVATGYAGHGEGLNNPQLQDTHNVGPLPEGFYSIGPAHTSQRTGPVTMNLDPDPGNGMYGREDFRIHGDNPKGDHSASDGCMVFGRAARETIDQEPDRRLQVVATL